MYISLIKLYIIFIFFLIISSCENSIEILGCQDQIACNYNSEATKSDNSCAYSDVNFNCEGNCNVDTDCNNVCGGSALMDDCGVCDGDNSLCPNLLYINNITVDSLDIIYSSNTSISGLQFSVTGINITNIHGILLEELGFTVSYGPQAIIIYSSNGQSIPKGTDKLITIYFDTITNFNSCLENVTVVDAENNLINFYFGDCVEMDCIDLDEDFVCDYLDLCVGEFDICGICNGLGFTNNFCDCYGNIDSDLDNICDNIDICIGEVDNNGYFCSDIHVLDDFRNLNYDIKSEEILDLGIQTWVNGRLERLYLYDLNLTNIPNSINGLTNLQKLYLNNNNITTLPNSLSELENIQDLNLDNNKIIQLPTSIVNNNSLQSLKLNNNLIEYLPNNIGNIQNLERIELKNNNLVLLPESITTLANLDKLWLDNNSLISLPINLCNLINCDIDVNGNNLCEQFYFDCIDDWLEQTCD